MWYFFGVDHNSEVYMGTNQNRRRSDIKKPRYSAVVTMRELLRYSRMGEVILLTQGGDQFAISKAKKSSPTAPRYTLWAKSGEKFVMKVRDSGIIINRETADPADNVGDNRITGFSIRGSHKGSWSLGRSD